MDKRARRYLRERVQRGVALLDRKVPGWDETIRVEKLDLGSTTYCVVGQAAEAIVQTVVGSAGKVDQADPFISGIEALGHSPKSNSQWIISHGFDRSNAERHSYGFYDLTEEWCDVLAARRLERQLAQSNVVEHLLETVQP